VELWETRETSLKYLKEKRQSRLNVFLALLELLDRCVDEYETRAASDTYARVCGLTLLKAKNLSVGSLSLLLDGLGQEAGALLRPLIEYTELLTYFRRFPEKATENALPKAGERAKAIEGIYHGLRQHLNENASHSSYSYYSLSHLLTPQFNFRKMQQFVPKVLDKNFTDLAAQIWLMLYEAALTLERILPREKMEELAIAVDNLKGRMIHVFELKTPNEPIQPTPNIVAADG
jgi:hypothetical protein